MIKSSCLFLVFLVVSIFFSSSTFADPLLSERYPEPWKEDLNVEITKVLVTKKIKDCGEYKYRLELSHFNGQFFH